MTEQTGDPNLIRARVDAVEKVSDGSRIRLRLSEDIEIEGQVLKEGSYLYATVNGFTAQRVKASVTSVLLGDQIKKIELSVYDLDGMEGFYVPSSKFREVSKDVGSNAMNMNMNFNQNSGEMSSNQWQCKAFNRHCRVQPRLSARIFAPIELKSSSIPTFISLTRATTSNV